jgi:photosystem II stability/assembly factor-like uncharacterized protein
VFKTDDRGTSWEQKRVLIEGPRGVSIADDTIIALAVDPQDTKAVYAATAGRGLLSSLDGGDSWKPFGLTGRVLAVAVDPKNKCTVYAAQGNKIHKTETCGRDWKQAWFDPKTDKAFTVIAVDWFNPTVVYAGSSEGDILRSTDAGRSWLVAKRAEAAVSAIVVDPQDSRIVYAGTRGDGIWKTLDGGNTWLAIRKQLSEFDNARRITHLVVDALTPTTVYTVSPYGLLRSDDRGETWQAVSLISPANEVDIKGFAVNPRESKDLQYVTASTLVISSDRGVTWTSQKLPSTRPATTLLVDAEDGKVLYVGMGPMPER